MIYIEIIYAFVVLILEIPSGIFSDKFGYKISIIISSILYLIDMLILIEAFNFFMFALSVVFSAMAGALASGAMNSLLYDSLKMNQKESDFEEILGKQNFYATLSGVISALSGAYLADKFGFTFNYYVSSISYFICVIISFSLIEPKTHNEKFDYDSEKFNFNKIIVFFSENLQVKLLVFYNIIFGSIIVYISEYYQIFLKEISLPISFLGIVLVFIYISEGVSQLYSYKIKSYLQENKLFFYCIFISSLCLISLNYIRNYYSLIFLILIFFLYGITEPLIMGELHHKIKSDRATIESFMSFGLRFFSIIIGLIFGYISTKYSIFSGFLFLGLFMFLYSSYYYKKSFI